MRQRRRIAAHGVCRDDAGRVLLVGEPAAGASALPGGDLDHGESPQTALVRTFAAQTGHLAEVVAVRIAIADVAVAPDRTEVVHTDRIVYDVKITRSGEPATGTARWVPFTAGVLGPPADAAEVGASHPVPDGPIRRMQRFAAYGLSTDSAGRLLLTRIADGYPGAGTWHLPGGGTDFGEQPVDGLLRELVEETGQHGRVTGLLEVVDRRIPQAMGPEGYPIDWHTVRAVYRVRLDAPEPLTVVEPIGGSTAEARWVEPGDLDKLPLNGFAKGTIGRHLGLR